MQPSWAAAEVGRTRKVTVDERAALSVRAYIRRRFTSSTTISMRSRRSTGTRSTCTERSKERRTMRSTASSSIIAVAEASRGTGLRPFPALLGSAANVGRSSKMEL